MWDPCNTIFEDLSSVFAVLYFALYENVAVLVYSMMSKDIGPIMKIRPAA